VNHLYLQLGRAIAGQCPPGFREATLSATLDDVDVALALACTSADGSQVRPDLDAAARAAIQAPLEDIREDMARKEGKAWRRCTVTLVAGGGFAMDVDY